MEWMLATDDNGPAIEKARRNQLHYSFILTTDIREPRYIYIIARKIIDDNYQTVSEEDALTHANKPNEVIKFLRMAIKLKELGFRYSNEGRPYLITESQFKRFFK